MAKRHFNWNLAIVLLLCVAVLVITFFGLNVWNRSRRAEAGLETGLKAFDKAQWHEAAKNLGHYIARVPNDVEVLLKYAKAQLNIRPLKQNNLQYAINAYRSVLRQDKGNLEAAETLLQIYLQINAPGEAEDIARKYLQVNSNPKIQRILALSLIQQRKFKEAEQELVQLVEKHPDEIASYELLSQLADSRSEEITTSSEKWIDDAVKNNPNSAQAYIIQGAYFFRHKNRDKCLAALSKAEKLDLSDPDLLLRLAREYLNLFMFDKAKHFLAEAQKEMPENISLWQSWTQWALLSGNKTDKINVAEEGLKAKLAVPWDFIPFAVDLFIQAGEYDQAKSLIAKLRENNIAPAKLPYFEGIIDYQQNQNYQAIKHLRQALEFGNKTPNLRMILAEALNKTGDSLSALNQMRILVSEQPDSFQSHLKYAQLLENLNKWPEASQQAEAALQIFPASLDAVLIYIQAKMITLETSGADKNSQEWQDIEKLLDQLDKNMQDKPVVKKLQLELALLSQNREQAEQLLQFLQQNYPKAQETLWAQIEMLIARDQYGQAEAKLRAIIKEQPDSFSALKKLVGLLARQKKYDEGISLIEKAWPKIQQPETKREFGFLQVELYQIQDKKDKAVTVLENMAQELPQDVMIKRRLLTFKQITQDNTKAQQLVDEIKQQEGPQGWQWKYEQARLWFAGKDFADNYSQAVTLLKENLLADPQDQASRLLLASIYERMGETQLAATYYREAYRRSPKDLSVIIPTVAALQKINEFDEADQILKKTSQEELSHPTLLNLEFISHIRRGQWDSGINILEGVVQNDPNNLHTCLLLSSLKVQQGKFDEAEGLLKKLHEAQPESIPVYIALIELQLKQNHNEQALKLCNELVASFPTPESFMVRGRTLTALNQTDQALKDFNRAIELAPNKPETWIGKSDFYNTIGQSEEAIAAIKKALELQPTNIRIKKLALALLLTSPNPAEVKQGRILLEEALKADPQDTQLGIIKARTLLAQGTYPAIKQAVAILENINLKNPKAIEAWLILGELSLQQNQPGKAVDLALRGLVNSPNNKSLLMLKARGEESRSPLAAISTLKSVLDIDPQDHKVISFLADTYVAAGQPAKAVDLLQQKLEKAGQAEQKDLKISLASAEYHCGAKEEALKELDLLFKADPRDLRPLLMQARLLIDDMRWSDLRNKLKQWHNSNNQINNLLITLARDLNATKNNEALKLAEETINLVLAKNPNNLDALQILAVIYQSNNQTDKLEKLYQKILSLNPDNIIALNNFAWLLCENKGKPDQALALAQKGLDLSPEYMDLIDTRGVTYYRLGQYQKAAQDFNKCIDLYPRQSPGLVSAYFHLARTQAKLNLKHEAQNSVKQALELNENQGGLSEADIREAKNLLK